MGTKIMMDQGSKSGHEVADYISSVTAQLAQMAASEQYTTLARVLEMAWLESEQLRNGKATAPLPQRRRAAG